MAIFLSYTAQDAAAAQRLSEALRAAGMEVWFDQSELRGGDAWDAAIRRQPSLGVQNATSLARYRARGAGVGSP